MAEEKVEAAAPEVKKKGKLPLIIIMVVLIVAGVFIGMKAGGKKDGPPPLPPIELGEIETLGSEFLANLADGRSYVRANIAVHLAKTFKGEELKKYLATLRDAVILCLSSKSMEEMNSLEGKESLKREIAYHINQVLEEVVEKKPGEKEAEPHTPEGQKPGVDPHATPVPVAPIQQPTTPVPGQVTPTTPVNAAQQPAVPITNGAQVLPQAVPANPAQPLGTTAPNGIPIVPQKAPVPAVTKPAPEAKPWDIPKDKRKFPDWDSDTGPVLMVYFTDFATQ